jgi:hypothetical protein
MFKFNCLPFGGQGLPHLELVVEIPYFSTGRAGGYRPNWFYNQLQINILIIDIKFHGRHFTN